MTTKLAPIVALALALIATLATAAVAKDPAENARFQIEEAGGTAEVSLRYLGETGALFASVRRPDGSLLHYRIDPTTRQATVTANGRVIFRFTPDAEIEPARVPAGKRIDSGIENPLPSPTFISEDFALLVGRDADRFRIVREQEEATLAFEALLAVACNDTVALTRPAYSLARRLPGKVGPLSVCAEEFTPVLGDPSVETLKATLRSWITRGLASCPSSRIAG